MAIVKTDDGIDISPSRKERNMRLIDADALMPNAEYKGKNDFVSAQDIANAPTIPAPRWVRCEERLPEKGKWVLAISTFEKVTLYNIATVDAGGTWWTTSPKDIMREIYCVTHWMPIEPPKEDA